MSLSTQPYKGARDFYPEDKLKQNYLFNVIREAVKKYGYEEYDAPILEPLEIYAAKSGDEIVSEQTYTFTDRGGRNVAIRPEMTPTVSRMVAGKRQQLSYPLRWFSIPNLWRYERPQRGRLREHWQLNVDLFGIAGLEADLEVVMVADAIFKAFKATRSMYEIRVSHRGLLNHLLFKYLSLSEAQANTIAKLIDKKDKLEHSEFIAQVDVVFSPSQREEGLTEKLLAALNATSLKQLPPELKDHSSAKEISTLLDRLNEHGVSNTKFSPSVVRGFDYYNGLVFEIYDNHPENKRSMMGGGRYDGLVGLFGVEPVPTVGFGLGDATLSNFLSLHNLWPPIHCETEVYAVIIGNIADRALKPVESLREMGLNVALDISGRKLGDQIKTAQKKGIKYVLIIGENELSEERYTLRDLDASTEEKHALERIVSIVKDRRQNI